MKKKWILLSLLILFVSIIHAQNKSTYPPELIQLHKNVLQDILSGNDKNALVKEWSDQLNEKGEWPDIDYTSKQRGSWPTVEHLSRTASLAEAYQRPGTGFYKNPQLKGKTVLALNYWLVSDLQNPNWWYPQIGVPMYLVPSLILMEDEITPEQMKLGIKILDRAKIGMTGQNKVWLSGNVLLKAMLQRDVETIQKASVSIQEELKVSLGEGIQPDGSFHQHGPQIQFGNYGLAYVGDMIKWIKILHNTPFQFNENKISVLRDYLLEGQQWIVWKNQMDVSACGRQLFVDAQTQKARSLSGMFRQMETLDPTYASHYKLANLYNKLEGNKHFWRSDFQIQRTADYYFSVKMCSERVIGAESCNSENIRGYYLGDGATYLIQSGKEYENIFPFWDWKKIPGTTTHQDNNDLPVLTAAGYRIPSNFVGGVSDGKSGIAAMDYIRNGLSARKSWFIFENYVVCLGSGINSSEGKLVTTSINQSLLNGETLVKTSEIKKIGQETSESLKPLWVLHNNTGYLFPEGGTLRLETKTVEGSWNRVASMYKDEIIKKPVFSLWLEHGTNPKDQKYAYVLIPGADKTMMQKLEKQPFFSILKNEKDVQAVISKDKSIGGAVFYSPGHIELLEGVEVSEPCILMMKKVKNRLEISVSDPTQKLTQIKITLPGNYKSSKPGKIHAKEGVSEILINLPEGDQAGKSITIFLTK